MFLTRELFVTSVNGFLKLKPRSKYEYLEMLCLSTSTLTNEFKDLSIPDTLKQHIPKLLSDLSSIVFGRGSNTKRLPMVQINTLLLLTKHANDVNLDVLEIVLGNSSSDGINLALSEKSILQVREAAFNFLLKIVYSHPLVGLSVTDNSSTTNNSIENSNEIEKLKKNKSLRLQKYICQILLNGFIYYFIR
jgi:hypothetical protein